MKTTFRVTGMECSNCAMRIEGLEDELPGVQSVSVSYARGQAVVEHDARRFQPEAFLAAVEKLGYHATPA